MLVLETTEHIESHSSKLTICTAFQFVLFLCTLFVKRCEQARCASWHSDDVHAWPEAEYGGRLGEAGAVEL